MITVHNMEESNLPEDALRFFHGLSNWVESSKKRGLKLIGWKDGQKKLSKIHCIKPKKNEPLIVPPKMEDNTLYIPTKSGGLNVISNIRHAFCHNGLSYDQNTDQYKIDLTDKVHIAGRFSLEAIKEFVETYTQANQKTPKKRKLQSKKNKTK